jgi:hypothetical protein
MNTAQKKKWFIPASLSLAVVAIILQQRLHPEFKDQSSFEVK